MTMGPEKVTGEDGLAQYPWLDRVESPADFRGWPVEDLEHLAAEVRQAILHTTSRTGGHVGASLGAVELLLAMHRVFDTPRDQLVIDIGHQAYGHKLVTGRRQDFDQLRQLHGPSGFLKRHESPYDVWEAGHSSTSLSAALGMAVARDLHHESHHVVAMIGDGAMTAGLAWEALNQIGHLRRRLIVVLNDNSMSIAPNVGALSAYLTDLRVRPSYRRLKQDVEMLLRGLPVVGGRLHSAAERVKDGLKHLVLPRNVFEELGFLYLGPLDGHDLGQLIPTLERAATVDGPVLLHVITQKGKGFHPAEAAPAKFHGPGPFDVVSGQFVKKSQPPSYSQVVADTLIAMARDNPQVVAITAAMPDSTGVDRFQAVFPDRAFDVGIAEQHATTFAAGLAVAGMRPAFLVYATFLQRAYDQVVHDVAHQNLPVVFGVDRAGLVGADGATHQGVYDVTYLRTIPNMAVAMGKDEADTRQLLYSAFQQGGPVALRYPRGAGRGVALTEPLVGVPWGRGEWLAHGEDATLVGFGPIVYTALAAAEELGRRGFRVGVVNARFAKPLDEDLLKSAATESGLIVTLEEHVATGGFGASVLEWAEREAVATPVHVLALPDAFIDHGPVEHFLALYGLTPEAVAARVAGWLLPARRRA
ncbi:MAG: 1-deoxy-D-xylulose-5-phosphate synthase [Thermaerobacter sp.]|nr:1-deoxy-D-xylulose-5-phosphate synthase [Thermaerobacter sp.]